MRNQHRAPWSQMKNNASAILHSAYTVWKKELWFTVLHPCCCSKRMHIIISAIQIIYTTVFLLLLLLPFQFLYSYSYMMNDYSSLSSNVMHRFLYIIISYNYQTMHKVHSPWLRFLSFPAAKCTVCSFMLSFICFNLMLSRTMRSTWPVVSDEKGWEWNLFHFFLEKGRSIWYKLFLNIWCNF